MDGDSTPNIRCALEVLSRSKTPLCFACLGLAPTDEDRLLAEFRKYIPPKHRIVEDVCGKCAQVKRVVRKVRAYP
jgi:hypothetical protein